MKGARSGTGALARRLGAAALLVVLAAGTPARAVERFPPPDFESRHRLPVTYQPPPRAAAREYVDLGVLGLALGAASYLALRLRSRRWLVALGLFSLAYFGFWRRGCVCPIGAIQNVGLAIADPAYRVSLSVVGCLLLPLAFALVFGRVFCAAVCPHGVLQDLFLLRPVRLPRWLDTALGVVPAIYLGIAVLSATLGGAFLVCRWDPLVPLMRLSGITPMALAGIALLVVSLFVGRPYCRFLCPLGVVLGWFSRVAWRPVTITPDECVRCRLCEDACPFGAIRTPVPADLARDRVAGRKRLVLAMAVLPLLVAAGGAAGWTAGRVFLRTHPTARMAEQALREERANDREGGAATRALRAAGLTADDLRARVASMSRRYRVGGTLFGAGAALCVGATLVGAGTRHGGGDYVPDRRLCVACGRCFACCPREWVRRRGRPAVAAVQPATDDGGRA